MTTQNITLHIPEAIYHNLKLRAAQAERTVEEETLEVLARALPADGGLPDDLSQAIASLKVLDDSSLRKAAASRLPAEVSAEMEQLHHKQQRESLNATEAARLADLVRQYEQNLLIRAQAAALLQERGHDVDELFKA